MLASWVNNEVVVVFWTFFARRDDLGTVTSMLIAFTTTGGSGSYLGLIESGGFSIGTSSMGIHRIVKFKIVSQNFCGKWCLIQVCVGSTQSMSDGSIPWVGLSSLDPFQTFSDPTSVKTIVLGICRVRDPAMIHKCIRARWNTIARNSYKLMNDC